MTTDYYAEYLRHRQSGLKVKAKKALHAFIGSFHSDEARSQWVWTHINDLPDKVTGRIRSELFRELVFPVLKRGYDNNELASILWLGRLAQNICHDTVVQQMLRNTSALQLYQKCFAIAPHHPEVRTKLLHQLIEWLSHTIHEWPTGILYGMNGANAEQCEEIHEAVMQAMELDDHNRYEDFIADVLNKLEQY